jgi:hypothetical protein
MVALERIADYIQHLVPTSTAAPNLTAPLESFATFDWSTITATVERSDQYGAAIVSRTYALTETHKRVFSPEALALRSQGQES